MPRNRVTDMDFDEVSTVDVPANQHGLIVLAKSASGGTTVEFTTEDGQTINGELVEDTEGNVFAQDAEGGLWVVEDVDALLEGSESDDGAQQQELELVGKSAFLRDVDDAGQSVFGTMSEQLRKALDDEGRNSVLAKAFAAQQVELAKAKAQADEALAIARAAQDREQDRMFIAKAAKYNVPIAPEVLGPILKRMTLQLPAADCEVIAGLLETSGDIFKSYGLDADVQLGDSPLADIEDYANDPANRAQLAKSYDGKATELSKEQTTVAFLNANPRTYSEMKRNRGL